MDNETRKRDYFLTINQNAYCYHDLEERLKNLVKYGYTGKLDYKYYCILHDKDIQENNHPKLIHKHAVICFKNPIKFSSVKNYFPGAHIEACFKTDNSIAYLFHATQESKEKEGNFIYPVTNCFTNDPVRLDSILTVDDDGSTTFKDNAFVDDDYLLMTELLSGKYHSFIELVQTFKYSPKFLSQRIPVINATIDATYSIKAKNEYVGKLNLAYQEIENLKQQIETMKLQYSNDLDRIYNAFKNDSK